MFVDPPPPSLSHCLAESAFRVTAAPFVMRAIVGCRRPMTTQWLHAHDEIDRTNSRLFDVAHAYVCGCRRYAGRKWYAVNLCNADLCPSAVILFHRAAFAETHIVPRIAPGYRRRGIMEDRIVCSGFPKTWAGLFNWNPASVSTASMFIGAILALCVRSERSILFCSR